MGHFQVLSIPIISFLRSSGYGHGILYDYKRLSGAELATKYGILLDMVHKKVPPIKEDILTGIRKS